MASPTTTNAKHLKTLHSSLVSQCYRSSATLQPSSAPAISSTAEASCALASCTRRVCELCTSVAASKRERERGGEGEGERATYLQRLEWRPGCRHCLGVILFIRRSKVCVHSAHMSHILRPDVNGRQLMRLVSSSNSALTQRRSCQRRSCSPRSSSEDACSGGPTAALHN